MVSRGNRHALCAVAYCVACQLLHFVVLFGPAHDESEAGRLALAVRLSRCSMGLVLGVLLCFLDVEGCCCCCGGGGRGALEEREMLKPCRGEAAPQGEAKEHDSWSGVVELET